MSDSNDDPLFLRDLAHRMSRGVEVKKRKHGFFTYRNTFLGTDAVEWLIADPKSGVGDLDGAMHIGQRLIEHGYVKRVSRERGARRVRHFGRVRKVKLEFRGGDSFYRFDPLRISPFQLHVIVRRAFDLQSKDIMSGKNDPYVKLRLGTQRAVTRVEMKTNDPAWNEHFVFGVDSVEAEQLHMTVCDYDSFKHDDVIGTCQVGLSHLPCEDATENGHLHEDCAVAEDDTDSDSAASTVMTSSEYRTAGGRKDDDGSDNGSTWSRHTSPGRKGRSRRRPGVLRKRRRRHAHKEDVQSFKPRLPGSAQNIFSTAASLHGGAGATTKEGPPQHGSENAIIYYRLSAPNEKRMRKEEITSEDLEDQGQAEAGFAKPAAGELGCDIWLTRLSPRELPVVGEAKFSLRCRLWEAAGVTSPEERNLVTINNGVIKHRAVIMLNGRRVSTASHERNKDKVTSFEGTIVGLDSKANMATDMVKFVISQKVSPMELIYKPVAVVTIPLRNVEMVESQEDEAGIRHSVGSESGSGSAAEDGRSSWQHPGEPRARRYSLQTMAGPLTSRTMANGFVVMSLMLSVGGNDLLGDVDPEDNEPAKAAVKDIPSPLSNVTADEVLACGYKRLRRALLLEDSKLMHAFSEQLGYTEEKVVQPWTDADGETDQEENMAGSNRKREFVIPKSGLVAATKAETEDTIVSDGPSLMVYETKTRTPGVRYGDKFVVVVQFLLVNLGENKCRLRLSSDTQFNDKVMGMIQSQIVSAVAKVSKENHTQLIDLIQDTISGAGSSGRSRRASRKEGSLSGVRLVFISLLMLSMVILAAYKGMTSLWGPDTTDSRLPAVLRRRLPSVFYASDNEAVNHIDEQNFASASSTSAEAREIHENGEESD